MAKLICFIKSFLAKFFAIKRPRMSKVLIVLFFIIFILENALLGYFLFDFFNPVFKDEDLVQETSYVAVVDIFGGISTYALETDEPIDEVSSDEIIELLSIARDDYDIKAVILRIDSTGGDPVAAEEVSSFVKDFPKPIVSVIRSNGLSAGYYIASAADRIFASPNSSIGSIGATMSYVDYYESNLNDGYRYNSLSWGKFKDMGDPDKRLTKEERFLIMNNLKVIYGNFIKTVAENRGLSIEKVVELADGADMPAPNALVNGLIDELGGMKEAEAYLKKQVGHRFETIKLADEKDECAE
jgi:protease-4